MKIYIKPEIETIDIETETVLAATIFESKEPTGDDSYNLFSKDHNFSLWDEDEEEE